MPCASTSGSLSEVPKRSAVACEYQDMGPIDTVIPGLDNDRSDGLLDTVTSSSLASTDMDDGSQDQAISAGKRLKAESVPSVSTEKSEELSSKTATVDGNIGMASTATSLGPVKHFVLPKMTAPVKELSGEDKDSLQKLVFLRIVEAYKHVSVSGGSQLRFSLLSFLGVELSVDLDPWTSLQTHILSDYVNHEGHELTLRVLYRLYGEAEEERDFFSSTTASSVYETFLLKVAETLRDSLPASDKSLSRLLCEVPYLPESSLKLLESLCSPEIGDRDDKELHSGDRVTQGLSAVWSLIVQRPTLRDVLLKIALQSAVHHMEEVRMKAIRLVANKLYPLPSIAPQIEEFAKDKLLSAVDIHSADAADTEKSGLQLQKNSEISLAAKDQATGEMKATESSAHASESCTSGTVSSTSVSEAQRCMSLYFALCTKKHSLLRQIFIIYRSSPDSVKQAIHSHMPILVRTMGTSPPLLEIIADPPDGSENLLLQVLQTLTDGRVPSTELISTVKKLYETKIKDIEILLPILSFLPKEEVLKVFSQVVKLPQDKFQAALTRLLQGSIHSSPVLTPPEVLIAIHSIDPDKDGIPLKKVTDACNACFEQRQMFTQQVIAKVLNQLVEQIPLPLLFMRTVLQAIGAFPALVDFIMEILSRLVSKQIWKYPKLWVGFLKCAQLTQPHSFNVLLQLPQAQLEGALNKIPALKAPLAAHAAQQKSTLPRSVLTVLGIASDSQAGSQSQSGQPEAGDAFSSDKEAVTEKSKESSGGS
ncbi:Symplekin [Bienertia sinuspersici]